MKYIANLNIFLLEDLGHGHDNIEYFQIGPYAKKFITEGGFEKYFENLLNEQEISKKKDTISVTHESSQCDYVIITALEEDEMERIIPVFTKVGNIKNDRHLIEYGYLTSNKDKRIAWSSQQATGMVDASILAAEMIIRFNPKFLIMPGVLGGKPEDTNIGDIVVSTKVFTVDKGKFNENDFKREIEADNTNSSYITAFHRNKNKIINYIKDSDPTRKNSINIHFEPVACVRQVINKKSFFIENIVTIERKAIALEMESYGIARACELINDGKTIPLIIKSVMDNTQNKNDGAKTYAAWTSAMFVIFILENDLI
ncbi:phosphorylase family protein [Spirosoma pollinicola]|uniref:Nucleoside phosphorylase domain-containing protein n=1 Tax=Spirosoma pollinicola TaxID=2057025 RepID=A0A2K8Z2E9_9BACT|nr:hypothetical protein [Spirosoma pollinicola]AUD04053.1 hypothetical protein CWM47_20805 [Spirosoma pollinicola]